MLISVKGAAQVHLDICKEIESGKRQNNSTLQTDGKILTLDYYSVLEKDVNALTSLQKKYPNRVADLCEDLLANMRNLLRAHNERLIRFSTQFIEENDLEPIANNEHCNSDCYSDQSNDLTRSDETVNCTEGPAKWNSLIHYLEAIDGELGNVSGNNSTTENTDFIPSNDNELDLDQFII